MCHWSPCFMPHTANVALKKKSLCRTLHMWHCKPNVTLRGLDARKQAWYYHWVERESLRGFPKRQTADWKTADREVLTTVPKSGRLQIPSGKRASRPKPQTLVENRLDSQTWYCKGLTTVWNCGKLSGSKRETFAVSTNDALRNVRLWGLDNGSKLW